MGVGCPDRINGDGPALVDDRKRRRRERLTALMATLTLERGRPRVLLPGWIPVLRGETKPSRQMADACKRRGPVDQRKVLG